MLWAAFPPADLWWLAPAGVAALSLAAAGRGAWAGAGAGLAYGVGFFTPLLHFTAVAMGNLVGWVALTLVESLYLALLGAAWALVSRHRRLNGGRGAVAWRVCAFAVLWCAVEELRSTWPWGGFPFGRLAYAMAQAPLLPLAAYGGSVGLSLAVALSGACLAEAIRLARGRRTLVALGAAAAAGAVVVAPAALPIGSHAENGTLRVGAVQGNVAEDFEDAFNRALEVTSNHTRATEQLAAEVGAGNLDVVIWPENAADLDPRRFPASAALVERAAQSAGTQVLVGAVLFEDGLRYNDMVVWTPGQGAGDYYRKHLPVPFAEYVPLRDQLRHITTQVDRIGTDMAPGRGPSTLTIHATTQGRDVPLAMGICFEVSYDDILRAGVLQGGQVIVIPTNNASFLNSSEAAQQLAQGQVQAVVHGRSVVQVSTVGLTAVISPEGVIEHSLTPYTQSALVAEVPLRTSTTIADRLGPVPGLALRLGGLVLLAAGIVDIVRTRRGQDR